MNLKIYMKSGNVIKVDKVESYTFKYSGNDITSIKIEQQTKGFFRAKNILKVGTINLGQIECVVEC